jgi:predicted Zn finger-like uncharacterized protein
MPNRESAEMNESFEFLCQNCDQRFRVAVDKVGAKLKCPRCQHVFTVPTPEIGAFQLADRAARRQAEPPLTFDEFIVYDDPTHSPSPSHPGPSGRPTDSDVAAELVPDKNIVPQNVNPAGSMDALATEPQRIDSPPSETKSAEPSRTIVISRTVIYVQAAMLMLVAMASFVFGAMFGGCVSGSRTPVTQAVGNRVVQGIVLYQHPKGALPDVGSVVLLVPTESEPQEPLDSRQFRDEVFRNGMTQANAQLLHSLQGEWAIAGRDGRFELELPAAGKYWLLVLSSSQVRPRHLDPPAEHLAEIGKYFSPAFDLLEDKQYRWQQIDVPRDEELRIQF